MRRSAVVLVLSVAATLLVGRALASAYAEWTWFASQGAVPVWRTGLLHEGAWRIGTFTIAFAFAFLNLYALRRSIVSLVLPRRLGNIEIGEAVSPRMLLAVVFGVSVVIAVTLSSGSFDWTTFALARIAGPFRDLDPYLDRDLSYVVAWLPFELDLYAWVARTAVVVGALILVLYALTPSLRLRRGDFYVSQYCRRHLAVLAAVALAVLAWRSRLDAVALTSVGSQDGAGYGAYQHHIGGPLLLWLSVITVVAAFIVLWGGWNGHLRLAAISGLAVAVGGPIIETVLPLVSARSLSVTEAADADRPYATTRRLFTRRAFGVEEIAVQPPGTRLAASAKEALPGISVWDPAALQRSVGVATAAPRPDLVWRATRDGIRASVLLPPSPDGTGSWRAVDFDATGTDDRGRALPAIPSAGDAPVPQVWDGLLVYPGAAGSRVVSDTNGHIPAPAFATRLERTAHAWNARSPRLAVADVPAVRPRIVFRRDVRERIRTLVPFLTVGPSIAPLLRGDSLYWVAELFTVARAYPLSERLMFAGALRPYVHHAATAFVHSATGRVTFLVSRNADAIMRTWARRFPGMFPGDAELPLAIAERRPPNADWVTLQATALARTGVDGGAPATGGTRAVVATDNADADLVSSGAAMFGMPEHSLATALPLVDASGTVLGAVLAVGGTDGITAWLPARQPVKWNDLLDQLQRSADSAGIGRQRRNARRGRVVAVPVASGLLFVQSHYEWGTDGPPTLAGVSTALGGESRAAGTLAEAVGGPAAAGPARIGAFRAAVATLHRRMSEALIRGDWTAFGSAFTALGKLLRTP